MRNGEIHQGLVEPGGYVLRAGEREFSVSLGKFTVRFTARPCLRQPRHRKGLNPNTGMHQHHILGPHNVSRRQPVHGFPSISIPSLDSQLVTS